MDACNAQHACFTTDRQLYRNIYSILYLPRSKFWTMYRMGDHCIYLQVCDCNIIYTCCLLNSLDGRKIPGEGSGSANETKCHERVLTVYSTFGRVYFLLVSFFDRSKFIKHNQIQISRSKK